MQPFLIKEIPYQETWKIRQQVMWPNKPLSYVKLELDPFAMHLGLFVKQELVSIISIFITKNEAQFRKFATLNQYQGKGYGSSLLSYTIDFISQEDINKLWCNARVDKIGYYKKFGLTETNQTFSKGNIDYVIMQKTFD